MGKENGRKERRMTDNIDNIYLIPNALYGACFHGEVWVRCPKCLEAIEIVGARPVDEVKGYRIYKCRKCGDLFKDR